MNFQTVSEPAFTAVDLSTALDHCVADEDASLLVLRLLKTAQERAEEYLDGFITQRTIDRFFMGFPEKQIELDGPLISVDSVSYIDDAKQTQTMTEGDDYYVRSGRYPAILPAQTWPITDRYHPESVTVRVTVGYASADAVPEDIKHAILLKVGELYENREESINSVSNTALTNSMKSLLRPYRRTGL